VFWVESRAHLKVKGLSVLTRALRNVSRRKVRVLLVVVALGFSMAIMISIPAGIVANQEATQNLSENYESTISDMQEEINETATLMECRTSSRQRMFSGAPSGMPSGMPEGQPSFGFGQEEAFVNETVVDEIRSIEGVKDVVTFLEVSSEETTSETMETPRGSFTISRPLYTITGVCLNSSFIDSYSILPTNITAGEPLHEGDSGVLLMSANLSDYFGIGVGDIVECYGEYFTVVGIYEPAGEGISETREVYMRISDARIVTGNVGNSSRLDVYAETVDDVAKIAEVIEAAYSDELYVTTYEDRLANLEDMREMYQTTLENAESTLGQTQATAFQVIVIAIVATSLTVLFTMLYTVRERTKEIGVLKAIGFSNRSVMSQFMLEGMLMSLMAAVVGVGIGIVGAPILSSLLLPTVSQFSPQGERLFGQDWGQATNTGILQSESTTIALDPQTLLLAFGAAVLLGAFGSLYPAWKASRTSPMEALRYE
jgi:putative ABC transport system permease protein